MKKSNKKRFLVTGILALIMVFSLIAMPGLGGAQRANAAGGLDTSLLKVGDYIQMGEYGGQAVKWRVIADERNGGNGLLVRSDIIIDKLAYDAKNGLPNNSNNRVGYGSDLWCDSNIRHWLNSEAEAGEVNWGKDSFDNSDNVKPEMLNVNPANVTGNPYDTKAGFLTSFTNAELGVIKEVKQRFPVNTTDRGTSMGASISTLVYPAIGVDSVAVSGGATLVNRSGADEFYNEDEFNANYGINVRDRMFLMDLRQVNVVRVSGLTYADGSPYYVAKDASGANQNCWTSTMVRDPNGCRMRMVEVNGTVGWANAYNPLGITPAFYIDHELVKFSGGNGTEGNPYVVDSSERHDGSSLSIGKYIEMGGIKWRVVADERTHSGNNGLLLRSDASIGSMAYDAIGGVNNGTAGLSRSSNGSDLWCDSNIRHWLNSDAEAGKVNWGKDSFNNAANSTSGLAYVGEAGFLKRFKSAELSVIKEVKQRAIINAADTNGKLIYPAIGVDSIAVYPSSGGVVYPYDSPTDQALNLFYKEDIYNKAWSINVRDRMFLMDLRQVNAVRVSGLTNSNGDNYYVTGVDYWTRTPAADGGGGYSNRRVRSIGGAVPAASCNGENGIVPAFYIDQSLVKFSEGDGTENDPYVVDDADRLDGSSLSVGKYVELGGIKWRVVADERTHSGNNGFLLRSDRVIANKAYDAAGGSGNGSTSNFRNVYGSDLWCDSNIRHWLNSEATAGTINWGRDSWDNSVNSTTNLVYKNEAGFLNGFTNTEKGVIKEVKQRSIINSIDIGGKLKYPAFGVDSIAVSGSAGLNLIMPAHTFYNENEFNNAYSINVRDRIFLMDLRQVNSVRISGLTYNNGDAYYRAKDSTGAFLNYFTRTPWATTSYADYARYVAAADGRVLPTGVDDVIGVDDASGIVPAFYIDHNMVKFTEGDGTEGSPYVVQKEDQFDGSSLSVGKYVQMGSYNGEPIKWRVVADERQGGNGFLLRSDISIGNKAFDAAGGKDNGASVGRDTLGSNLWGDSNIRHWLNSNDTIKVDFGKDSYDGSPNSTQGLAYANEKGFLTNFRPWELAAVKEVKQKSIIFGADYGNINHKAIGVDSLSIFGTKELKTTQPFNTFYNEADYNTSYSLDVRDRMFLLDVKQLNTVRNSGLKYSNGEDYWLTQNANGDFVCSWTRTPNTIATTTGNTVQVVYEDTVENFTGTSSHYAAAFYVGVVPAFYIDHESVEFESGAGTEGSPYVIKATHQIQDDIEITSDNEVTYGDTLDVEHSLGSGDGDFTYSVIKGNGSAYFEGNTLIATGAGQVTIRVTKAGGDAGEGELPWLETYTDQVITVNKRVITVTADDITEIYKRPLPTLTYSFNENAFAFDDTAESVFEDLGDFVLEAVDGDSNPADMNTAGTYIIRFASVSAFASENYELATPVEGELTVVRNPVLVTYVLGTDEATLVSDTIELHIGASYGELVQNVVRQGYDFTGWYLDGATDPVSDYILESQVTATDVEGEYTLNVYAGWEAFTYPVTFELGAGSSADDITGHEFVYGEVNDIPFAKPTLANYTLEGWVYYYGTMTPEEALPYANEDGEAIEFRPMNAGVAIAKNTPITVVAVWEIVKYDITFVYGSTTATVKVPHDGSYLMPVDVVKSVKPQADWNGYYLAGWTVSTGGSIGDVESITNVTASATYTAIILPHTFTVVLDVNDPAATVATASGDATYDAGVDLSGLDTIPALKGHTFLGWFDDANVQYTDGEGNPTANVWKYATDDIVLYAHWDANTYEVTFNSDGGSAPSPSKIDVKYGTEYGALNGDALPTVTMEGYAFQGWYDEENNLIAADTELTALAKNHTLTARWLIQKFTVTFNDQNGGVYTPVYENFNTVYSLPSVPARDGFTPLGWYNGNVKLSESATHKVPGHNLDLVFKWEPLIYTVRFEWDGGFRERLDNLYGAEVVLPAEPAVAGYITGYTFDGWYVSDNFIDENRVVLVNGKYKVLGNDTSITVYGNFVPVNYSVSLDIEGTVIGTTFDYDAPTNLTAFMTDINAYLEANPGYWFDGWYDIDGLKYATGAGVSLRPWDKAADGEVLYANFEIRKPIVTFMHDGVVQWTTEFVYGTQFGTQLLDLDVVDGKFEGWYRDENTWLNRVSSTDVVTGDITIYAKTRNLYQFAVTFNFGDGRDDQIRTVVEDTKIGDLLRPDRTGYTFGGWYLSAGFLEGDVVDKDFIPESNTTLYAKWTVNSYKVSFYTGTATGTPLAERNVTFDAAYGELPAASKTGYTFAGWYLDLAYENEVTAATIVKTGTNHSLFARFTANSATITFELNGGKLNATTYPDNAMNVVYDAPLNLPRPTKAGHIFKGWYTDSKFSNEFDATKVNFEGDITLYAKWEARSCGNGGTLAVGTGFGLGGLTLLLGAAALLLRRKKLAA